MSPILDSGLVWWITVVDIPALSGLFWLYMRLQRDSESAIDALNETLEMRCSQLREALSAFKLEAAKTYVSVHDVRDLESKLVAHLLRIEIKLDKTAMITAALKAQNNNQE